MLSLGAGVTIAAEPTPSTDDLLLRQLLGDDESVEEAPPSPSATETESTDSGDSETPSPSDSGVADGEAKAIKRILTSLGVAETRLKEAQTDKVTQSSQDVAIEELERLIEAAKRQQPARSESSSNDSGDSDSQSSSQPQPRSEETSGDSAPQPAASANGSDGSPRKNRDGKAEESSDRALDDRQPSRNLFQLRSDLVRDSWGHLPPRLRDQLLNAGSDKNLPQYDSLVRKYFESLARPDAKDDRRN